MQIKRIFWVGLLTESYDELNDFFLQKLQLQVAYRDDDKVLAHFRLPSGQLIETYGPSNRQRKEKYRCFNGPAIGFEVEDIHETRQKMEADGVKFITEVETWEDEAWALFLGPEGVLFEIAQPSGRESIYRVPANKHFGELKWAGAQFQDFEGAVRFFDETMHLPSKYKNDEELLARFEFLSGHIFDVFGPTPRWQAYVAQPVVGFKVDDIQETCQFLASKGVKFLNDVNMTIDGDSFTVFRTPGDFKIWLWDEGVIE